MEFLSDNSFYYTDGKTWYDSLIKTYNYEAPVYSDTYKNHPIPVDIKMPDYTKLPDK